MHACTCIDRSSRPPNAPPTPASVSRTFPGGRPSAAQICFWSKCSHWVATYSSTPPSSAGTASPDSGPRNAWSCITTSYSPTTTTSATGSGSPFPSVGDRRLDFVVDPDGLGRLAGDLGVIGVYQRDLLTGVAHRVDGEHRLV